MGWIALAVLGGCAANQATPSEELAGTTWVGQSPDSSCVLRVTFDDDGEGYEMDQLCALTSGRVGMEGEQGHYEVDGGDIVFYPENATCPRWSDAPTTAAFEFLDGGRMQISVPQGVFVGERAQQGDGSGGLHSGCFDAQGSWVDAEWQAV